jgi:hypothetical protein
MRSEAEICEKIQQIKKDYSHVLTGTIATVFENAPRALMQLEAETQLRTLHWFLDEVFKSKLKPRS